MVDIFTQRHELILDSEQKVTHYIRRNDLQPSYPFHMMNADFTDIDLSSATIQVHMAHVDSGTVVASNALGITFTNTVHGDSAVNGKGRYLWAASDTNLPGLFAFEFQVTPITGGVFTMPNRNNAFVRVNSDVANI